MGLGPGRDSEIRRDTVDKPRPSGTAKYTLHGDVLESDSVVNVVSRLRNLV